MAKRAADDDLFDGELGKLLTDSKCDVCFVPLAGKEAADKHYAGKIHAKKLDKWKINYIGMKKQRLEEMESKLAASLEEAPGSEEESEETEAAVSEQSMDNLDNPMVQLRKAVEDNKTDIKEESETPEKESVLASGSLDPKQLDSMDPAEMRKLLSGGKKRNRWDSEDMAESKSDTFKSDDFSIPTQFKDLMKRCFNRRTGLGYCPICNKLFR